jgi:hypothetical protein
MTMRPLFCTWVRHAGGDALKMRHDWGVTPASCSDISDTANGGAGSGDGRRAVVPLPACSHPLARPGV